ncbi:MAG: hypothetical protein JSS14_15750 [Proteobacteria bacterium]|nr:hypothetical protein [Pseudomonadota bacterium]
MSDTHDLFARTSSILRMPVWYAPGVHEERELSLEPGAYKVTPGENGSRWTVTLLKTGETVYNGIGPVEVIRA